MNGNDGDEDDKNGSCEELKLDLEKVRQSEEKDGKVGKWKSGMGKKNQMQKWGKTTGMSKSHLSIQFL